MTDTEKAIAALVASNPQFHGKPDQPTSWASQRDILQFIADSLGAGGASVETGCGYSTVIFAAAGSRHTVVTPARTETENVVAYCSSAGIDTGKVTFAVGRSQDVLPTLADDGPLDFVYIDGAHRFPYPCMDWVYTERRVKTDGLVLVDDIRIPTCRILHDFLLQEKNWRLERYIRDTGVFRKTADTDYSSDWQAQSYNRTFPDWSFLPRSQRPGRRSLPRSILSRLKRLARPLR